VGDFQVAISGGFWVAIRVLSLHHVGLKKIPPQVFELRNLTRLYLKSNAITNIPSNITVLKNLKELDLYINKLTALPPEIGLLNNLEDLSLDSNELGSLPKEICQLDKLRALYLGRNPLKQPPQEIATAKDNIKRIRDYFTELEAQGEDYIYEAKLILVGEPGAGKTSLSKKLMNPSYKLNPTEEMTKGIDVERWKFPYSKGISFQCNIWDFGGQEIMHATHRYFLTKRSLYILVADNRKEDTDFYYWLHIIELLSGNSPILIALNEKYKYKKYVPENILKSFNNVQKVFNINLADNTGLEDLSKTIQRLPLFEFI